MYETRCQKNISNDKNFYFKVSMRWFP